MEPYQTGLKTPTPQSPALVVLKTFGTFRPPRSESTESTGAPELGEGAESMLSEFWEAGGAFQMPEKHMVFSGFLSDESDVAD